MSDADAYSFVAPLLRTEEGLTQHYVPLPTDVADRLQAEGVRRVVGTMNGHPVNRGVISNRHGERFLLLGLLLMRDIGIDVGDMVEVEVRPDRDPDRIEMAEEFEIALEQDAEAGERYYAMTPGRRRSLNYYVASAKRPETRIKRALEVAHKLRTNTLYGDLEGRG